MRARRRCIRCSRTFVRISRWLVVSRGLGTWLGGWGGKGASAMRSSVGASKGASAIRSSVGASKGASGQAGGLHFGGRLGTADCLPVLSLAARRRNSLRALRALRSNSRRQVSSRSALRVRATSLPLLSAEEAPPVLPERTFAEPSAVFGESTTQGSARGGRHPAGAISGAARSAGSWSARLRASISDSPRLFERSARRARSEFCGATLDRAPQRSRLYPADRSSMSPRRVPPAVSRADAASASAVSAEHAEHAGHAGHAGHSGHLGHAGRSAVISRSNPKAVATHKT